LGKTLQRDLDAVFTIRAVKGISSDFYSFGTSTTSADRSVDMMYGVANQFSEFFNLSAEYGLVKVRSVSLNLTRNSTILTSPDVMVSCPAIFLQVAPNSASGAVTNTATSDNSFEYNLNTYQSRSLSIPMPPLIVLPTQGGTGTDYHTFGSNAWLPTKYQGVYGLPELFLNLGWLGSVTFAASAPSGSWPVLQVHVKVHCEFACPTNQ